MNKVIVHDDATVTVVATEGMRGPQGEIGTVDNAGVNAAIETNPGATRTALELGTAAQASVADFATAAQGDAADAALPATGGTVAGTLTVDADAAAQPALVVKATRRTGVAAQVQIQADKNTNNGASVEYVRGSASRQVLFAFVTGSSANPDGFVGTVGGYQHRLYMLGGNGSGGSMAVDRAEGLMVGQGLFANASARIAPDGTMYPAESGSVAAAPAASACTGGLRIITGTVDGYALCWSDGSNWINVQTGAPIA